VSTLCSFALADSVLSFTIWAVQTLLLGWVLSVLTQRLFARFSPLHYLHLIERQPPNDLSGCGGVVCWSAGKRVPSKLFRTTFYHRLSSCPVTTQMITHRSASSLHSGNRYLCLEIRKNWRANSAGRWSFDQRIVAKTENHPFSDIPEAETESWSKLCMRGTFRSVKYDLEDLYPCPLPHLSWLFHID
jgi:hypothetical protein